MPPDANDFTPRPGEPGPLATAPPSVGGCRGAVADDRKACAGAVSFFANGRALCSPHAARALDTVRPIAGEQVVRGAHDHTIGRVVGVYAFDDGQGEGLWLVEMVPHDAAHERWLVWCWRREATGHLIFSEPNGFGTLPVVPLPLAAGWRPAAAGSPLHP